MSQQKATLPVTQNINVWLIALCALALGFAAVFGSMKQFSTGSSRQAAAPAAKADGANSAPAAAAAPRDMDLGGGYVLDYGPDGAVVRPSNPPMFSKAAEPSAKTVDIGGGYVLKDTGQGMAVVPVSPVEPKLNIVRYVEIGGGRTLVIDGNQSTISTRPQPQTIDLGAGYTLKLDAYGGSIVPPSSVKDWAASSTQSIDLGAGYTLKLNRQGGTIIAPETNWK